MKKYLFALLSLCLPMTLLAQYRWADSVLGYSSQYSTGNWAAYQILGLPNTYPNCGDIATAWASASVDGQREYMELRFPGSAPVNTIQIYETNAPGAIDTVYVWNPGSSTWTAVYTATAASNPACPNKLLIRFTTTSFNVDRIRIAINSPAVSSWNELDAVAIGLSDNGGVVGQDQMVCAYGGTPDVIASFTPAFPDSTGTPSYQWQQSPDSITWADISGASTATYQPGAVNTPDTIFFRRRAILNTDTAFSNTVTIQLPTTAINTSTVGQDEWRLFGYNGSDISLTASNVNPRGYYVDTTLSFNTTVDWNINSSPSSRSDWQGCSVNSDNFSMSATRRGFPPGFYTFQMPFHDDPGMAFKNGQQIFYTGGCCGTGTVFNIGHLGPNDTLEARFAEGGGGAGMQVVLSLAALSGGTISTPNTVICQEDSLLLNSTANASGGQGDMFGSSYHYQWQDSISGASWINLSGATSASYQTHPLADSAIYFRRMVTDDSSYVAYSNILRIGADTLKGNPAVYGINEWRFYAYNGLDMSLNPSNVQFRGYYTDTALNFDTQNDWSAAASPSSSTKYQGCPVQTDNFTMSIKRVGFPTGPYVVSFPQHDDNIQVYRNGVLRLSAGCCNQNPFASLGGLDATDTLEYRFGESTSPAYLQTLLRQQDLAGGTIAGDETVCGIEQPTVITGTVEPSGGYAPLTYTYQWQDSIAGGTWTNTSGTNANYQPDTIHVTHYYRRKVSDSTLAIAYSNIVTKIHANLAGNPSDTGNGVWNVYGYGGASISLSGVSYKGFYIDSALSTNTTNFYCNGCAMSAAANWQGCPIGADYYTSVFRRRGFPAGNYNVGVYHDDDLLLLKNGRQIYSSGCCPNTSVNVGFLNADSILEFRLVEYGGGNYLQTSFVKIDSGIAEYRNTNCNSYPLANVAGNNWWDFTDDSGRVVASLNPNGNNLGTVVLNMKHFGTSVSSIPKTSVSNIYYMPRYYNWESSAYPSGGFPSPVTIRIYYKTSELDSYKVATSQTGLTAANLDIYHYDGINEDCNINNNSGGSLRRSTTTNTFTPSGFYLEANIPSFSEIGVSGGTQALPVTLTDFDALRKGNTVALNWKTATEYACKGFEVQRSTDGYRFVTLGFVPGAGTKTTPSLYAFTDAEPSAGKNYYRLLQTDVSGRYEASSIRMVDMAKPDATNQIAIYPNPVNNILNVQLSMTGPVSIRITAATGATIYEESVNAAHNTHNINMGTLPAGIYLVQVNDGHGGHWQQQITKR